MRESTEQVDGDPGAGGLFGRVFRSSLWTFAGGQSAAILGFVTSVVAARVLEPSELGRYALVAGVVSLVGTATSLQAGGYYVVAPDASARLLRCGLGLEIGLGLTALALLTGGAAVYGALGDDWEMTGLLATGGAVLLLNPIGNLKAWFARRLSYRTPTLAQWMSSALSGFAKIALLVLGFGIWGLVVGDVILSAAFAAAMWAKVPDGRGLVFDRELIRRQLGFGIPALMTAMLGNAIVRVQEAAVLTAGGTGALGVFYIAYRFPAQIYQLARSFGQTLLPAFSRATGGQLERGFAIATRMSGYMMALPTGLAIGLAGPFVETVFGPTWNDAALPLALITLAFAARFATGHVGPLLQSRERMRTVTLVVAGQLIVTGAFCFVATAALGVAGSGVGLLAAEAVLTPVRATLARTIVDVSMTRELVIPTIATAVVAGISSGIYMVVPSVSGAVLGAAAATAALTLVLWIGERTLLARLWQALRPRAPA